MPLAPSTARCFWSSVQLNAYNKQEKREEKEVLTGKTEKDYFLKISF